jgi:proteic killer suppression protein
LIEAQDWYEGEATGPGRRFRQAIDALIERMSDNPDAATSPVALDLRGYRPHRLKGDLKGFWSVTVRANWRIMFRFEGPDVFDVELIDYH